MKYIDIRKKPGFFKFLRFSISIFFKRRKFIGIEYLPQDASIIVSNHSQLYGSLTSEMYFPTRKYTWCISNVMEKEVAQKYIYTDFWSKKSVITRPFFKLLSYIVVPLSVYIFNHADTIPVYKDARILKTYKITMEALEDNANIVIFPESSEEYNDIINNFQDKFIDVARLYYKKTGKELSFVPMYNAVRLKKVVFGKPIKYDPNIPMDIQRDNICEYLKKEITMLAKELPRHKVVPYANIKRRKQHYSK